MSTIRKDNRRDDRIDFFRGLALLSSYSNHITGPHFHYLLMPLNYFIFGSAAIFFYISGYVSGLVYWKYYKKEGFIKCLKKSYYRFFQIYIAAIIISLMVIFISLLVDRGFLGGFTNLPLNVVKDFSFYSLVYLTFGIDPIFAIDVFYYFIFILIALPFILFILEKIGPRSTMLLSVILYLLVVLSPNYFHFFGAGNFFNPLAYQIYYVFGILFGSRGLRIEKSKLITIICWTVCIVLVFVQSLILNSIINIKIGDEPGLLRILFSRDTYPGFIQLLHFFSVAYLISVISSPNQKIWNSKIIKIIASPGRFSLNIYGTGIIISLLGSLIYAEYNTILVELMVVYSGFIVLIALGWYLSYRADRNIIQNS